MRPGHPYGGGRINPQISTRVPFHRSEAESPNRPRSLLCQVASSHHTSTSGVGYLLLSKSLFSIVFSSLGVAQTTNTHGHGESVQTIAQKSSTRSARGQYPHLDQRSWLSVSPGHGWQKKVLHCIRQSGCVHSWSTSD